MKNIFEKLIVDFHEAELPRPSPREFTIPVLPENVRKAFVFIGMRRSGKTWAMYQQMHTLLNRGVDKRQLVYINFEDDRLLDVSSKDLQRILDAYFEIYPQYINDSNVHFFFDEIHEVEGWEKFVRRLLDQEKVGLYISGSSSKMLGKEIASTLRGRTIVREIFPFSFREYLHFKQENIAGRLTTKRRAIIAHHGKEFLRYGGFPETVSLDPRSIRELLQGYIDVVVYRDIIERHKVGNTHVVRELIKYCLQNVSSLMSVNKIYSRFKSQGKSLGKSSLYEYMEYLEDAYCVFTVPVYRFSANERAVNPRKLYCNDQGLITAYTVKPDFEEASRLENAVFCRLRRETEQIFYYKTARGKEVDFLALFPDDRKRLYQVCVSLSDQETRDREILALQQAMEELGLQEGVIVTGSEAETISQNGRRIICVPAWEWLLRDA